MEKKIKVIVDYLKRQEKSEDNLNLGAEYEYLIVDRKDYKTVSYYGEKGIEYIFKKLVEQGWQPQMEGDHVLGATKDGMVVTTEPGGQFEYSNTYKETIQELEKCYLGFLESFLPILDDLGYDALGIGYHPVTKIDEIKLLPKSRYDAMFNYFKTHGSMSHNMMKGTAGLQLSIDFTSEEDYRKKSIMLNGITNILYSMFANSYFFEGQATHENIREKIWRNTDPQRTGLSKNAFIDDSYEGYAKYLLDTVAIFAYVDGKMQYTGEKKISEFIYEGMPDSELEHLMTMVFPDVRTKKFLEVRSMDAVPYPLNLAAYALIKGLVYYKENVEELYNTFKDLKQEDIYQVRDQMFEKGEEAQYLGQTIRDWKFKLIEMAKNGLGKEEEAYLNPLEKLVKEDGNLYNKTKRLYKGEQIKDAVSFNKIQID